MDFGLIYIYIFYHLTIYLVKVFIIPPNSAKYIKTFLARFLSLSTSDMYQIIIKKIKGKVIEALPTTGSYSGRGKRSSRYHFSKKKKNLQLPKTGSHCLRGNHLHIRENYYKNHLQ